MAPIPPAAAVVNQLQKSADFDPAASSGLVTYGFLVATDEPFRAGPGTFLVGGNTRMGKTNTLVVILRQLAGHRYVVDGHAGAFDSLATALKLAPDRVGHDQAGAVNAVDAAWNELQRRIAAARRGEEPAAWEPWTVAIDELDRVAQSRDRSVDRMMVQLSEIAGQGYKFGVFAILGTQYVAGPLSVILAGLRRAAGLIVHQVHGANVYPLTGLRTADFPANPARFGVGEALVRLPGHSDFAHVQVPKAPQDGAPLQPPPRLDRDAEDERRQTDRLLAGEQQVKRERISAALEAIEDVEGDHVARLRGQLNKALGVVRQAVNQDDLDRELAPYLQDIDAALRLRNHADLAAYKRDRLEQLGELRAECDRLDLADFDPNRSRLVELDRKVRQARSVADLDRLNSIGERLGDDIAALMELQPAYDDTPVEPIDSDAMGQLPGPRPIYVLPDLDAQAVRLEALYLAHGRTERQIPLYSAPRQVAPAPDPGPVPDPWRMFLDELQRRRLCSYRGPRRRRTSAEILDSQHAAMLEAEYGTR